MQMSPKRTPATPEEIQSLTPAVFHILLALADHERHGYAIMQEVFRNSDGRIEMGAGTLYGTVKRLLATGMIEEAGERPDPQAQDERRRYYRLTPSGRSILNTEVSRMNNLINIARSKQPGSQTI
jgi:DNA-binding PadR family transcriptional regulator